MERIPYGVYSKELREEAVKLVREAGLSRTGGGEEIVGPHQRYGTGQGCMRPERCQGLARIGNFFRRWRWNSSG